MVSSGSFLSGLRGLPFPRILGQSSLQVQFLSHLSSGGSNRLYPLFSRILLLRLRFLLLLQLSVGQVLLCLRGWVLPRVRSSSILPYRLSPRPVTISILLLCGSSVSRVRGSVELPRLWGNFLGLRHPWLLQSSPRRSCLPLPVREALPFQ